MDAIWIPVIVALVASIGSPLVLAYIARSSAATQAEVARQDKREDWARQDLVADRVTAAADRAATVAAQAEQAAALLLTEQASTKEELQAKLTHLDDGQEALHKFLNSDKTASMNNTLLIMRTLLVALEQNIDIAGGEPSTQAAEQIRELEAQIDAMSQAIEVRERTAEAIDAAAIRAAKDPEP